MLLLKAAWSLGASLKSASTGGEGQGEGLQAAPVVLAVLQLVQDHDLHVCRKCVNQYRPQDGKICLTGTL